MKTLIPASIALAALLNSTAAFAEDVSAVSLGMGKYFEMLSEGSSAGAVHAPLLLVMTEPDRIEMIVSGNGETPPTADEIVEILDGTRPWKSSFTGIEDRQYLNMLEQMGDSTSQHSPRLVLIRLGSTAGRPGPELITFLDDSWERSTRDWHARQDGRWHLMLIELQPR